MVELDHLSWYGALTIPSRTEGVLNLNKRFKVQRHFSRPLVPRRGADGVLLQLMKG